jgi:pimeloyl-ACP methyl ester carboxylesterase
VNGAEFPLVVNGAGERLDVAFVAARGGAAEPGAAGVAAARPPLAILGHGVTSAHDRPYLVALGTALAERGIDVARVSYAGNGASEGRFDECRPAKEVGDLGAVMEAAWAAGWRRFGYAGHSMGGAVGVLRAAEEAAAGARQASGAGPRLAALVSLAGMFHVAPFFARVCGALRYGEPIGGRAGCPWNRALDEDARRLGSLDAAAAAVGCPWLLVHGTMDELVPLTDSFDARAAWRAGRTGRDGTVGDDPEPEFLALSGVDHRFTGAIEGLVRAVAPWMAERLA